MIYNILKMCGCLGAALFLLLLSSCDNPGAYVEVLQGNYAYTRGEYEEANLHYLQALEYETHSQVISYNLGNVYYALGENTAALDEWEKAAKTDIPGLLSKVEFNKGVLYYELSRYEHAYQAFKNSLRLDPGDKSAKINLEYSLRKLNAVASSGTEVETAETAADASVDVERMMDYIRRKEQELLEERAVSAPPERDVRDW